ncbi:MAG: alpha/beta fold hydrolase [Saprospiraceae bacterium]|jgi:predicted alpha/beta-fold hydrolase|nr:alpha/beta fold hydrolase [Saprospiraceae bacterium]
MPNIRYSSYPTPPFFLRNGHLQTILPSVFRKIEIAYERERITLSDGDFLDLDWLDRQSKNLVILSHGLEGNSSRQYIKGMAEVFKQQAWDVLAWNCRSCSGEMNRALRLYNHGDINDIEEVVKHVLKTKNYEKIALVGFSMGGSITLKYMGVHGKNLPDCIIAGVAFSSPCDLKDSIRILEEPSNWIYKRKFMHNLKSKILKKAEQFPQKIDTSKFDSIKKWRDFDQYFSAPINGYDCPEDFYYRASAKNFIYGIRRPALLVNAQNDPILTPACSPKEICKNHPFLYLETPKYGGHIGFGVKGKKYAWSEIRALEFVNN